MHVDALRLGMRITVMPVRVIRHPTIPRQRTQSGACEHVILIPATWVLRGLNASGSNLSASRLLGSTNHHRQ